MGEDGLVPPEKTLRQKRARTKKALTEGEMLACTKCPRKFCTPSQLRHHMKGHGAAAPMLCEHCGFSTIHFASMNIHRRMHDDTEQKFHQCKQCPRLFPNASALARHVVKHGAAEPMLCDICGFQSRHYSTMNLHRRSHDVSLQYKCTWPGCDYTTIRRSRLDDHINSHEGIKNHVCSTCGKAYSGRKHLNRHEQSHNKDKILRCDECNYESPRRDKLREHIKKHHPGTAIIKGYMHPDELNKPKPPRPPKKPKDPKEPKERKPRTPRKPKQPKAQQQSAQQPPTTLAAAGVLPLDVQNLAGVTVTTQSGLTPGLPAELQSVVHKEETITSDYMDIEGERQAFLHVVEDNGQLRIQPRTAAATSSDPSHRDLATTLVSSPPSNNQPPLAPAPSRSSAHHPLFQFPTHMLPATAFSEEMLQLLQTGSAPGQGGFMVPGQNPGASSSVAAAANMSVAAAAAGGTQHGGAHNYVVNNANPAAAEQSWYVMHYPQ